MRRTLLVLATIQARGEQLRKRRNIGSHDREGHTRRRGREKGRDGNGGVYAATVIIWCFGGPAVKHTYTRRAASTAGVKGCRGAQP
jgi:hypothetical protein